MWRRRQVWRVGLAILFCYAPATAFAEGVAPTDLPSLVVREMKITGDEEFVVLQATQPIDDLSVYWTGYDSSDSANPNTIVPDQRLPAYTLDAGQAVLMTSDGAMVCDAVATTKLSASLSNTKGVFVIRELQSSGFTSTFTTIDSVNWAKSTSSTPTTAQLDLRLEASDMNYPVWYHDPAVVGASWRLGDKTGCALTLMPLELALPDDPIETIDWTVAAIEPPAIIEAPRVVSAGATTVVTSNLNPGLAPPLITEILPNPMGTGTDDVKEFIELYNSNDKPFNLSSFILQTGTSSTHEWQIPVGVTIPAKGFKVFYAPESGLSLSNSGGAAALYDVTGKVVAQTDAYTKAPDGQAWALASGSWYWTTKLTPGATNYISAPIVKSATSSRSLTTKPKVAGTTTTTSGTKSTPTATATNSTFASNTKPTPFIHPLILAGVALLAIGYGIYEYRHDLANALHKLRKH